HSVHMSRWRVATSRVLAVILAILFFYVGFRKLGAASPWGPLFAKWGFPGWVRPTVGVVEMLCAAALLVPAVQRWAAAALGAVMAGAIATHLWHRELVRVAPPAVLTALLVWMMMWRPASTRP